MSGNFLIAAAAASGVKPATAGIVYRSGPLEIINFTAPPADIRPPPPGVDSMISPEATLSSKRFSTMVVKPNGVSAVTASS